MRAPRSSCSVLERLRRGPVAEEAQDEARATYAPKITRGDAPLDWRRPAQALHDQVRGLHPWPHASFSLRRPRASSPIAARCPAVPHRRAAGDGRGDRRAWLDVAAGDGTVLRLVTLQLEGGRPLSAAAFQAGRGLAVGEVCDPSGPEPRPAMIAPARRAALEALGAVASGRRDLGDAVDRARRGLDDPRDVALCHELVVGTLRWQSRLDAAIAALSRVRLSKLDLEVLLPLRLAAYQLLFLSRVPASAVVHDAVAQVRAARKTSAAGLVNAVLRRLSAGEGRALPPRPDGRSRPIAINGSSTSP